MTTEAHQSLAQQVLTEATAQVAAAEAPAAAPAAPEQATQAEGQTTSEESPGEGVEGEGAARTLSWGDAMKQVPKDIAALMKNMQGDYTKKTQEVAAQRKEMQREREALMKAKQALEAQAVEIPEYDPFNEASIQARIEAEVQKKLAEALAPMEQEYQILAAEEQYQNFVRDNPDFTSDAGLRTEVQKTLETNPSLDLETAYWAVKGRLGSKQRAASAAKDKAVKAARREAALKGTGTGRRAPTGPSQVSRSDLKKMSAADIYKLAQERHRS